MREELAAKKASMPPRVRGRPPGRKATLKPAGKAAAENSACAAATALSAAGEAIPAPVAEPMIADGLAIIAEPEAALLTVKPSFAVPDTGEAIQPVAEVVAAEKPIGPAKRQKTVNPVDPASEVAVQPVVDPKPAAVPSAEIALLDQRISEAREAMNRLASELSVKRIELAGLRSQRAALGPLPRSRRDPGAPRRFTLLDAAAQVLDNAMEPMGAKAIWRAIVDRGLWSSPNGGKTPYATLPAAIMRDMAAKGAGSRFVKAGRGLFAANRVAA